jgi:hypothetical protein
LGFSPENLPGQRSPRTLKGERTTEEVILGQMFQPGPVGVEDGDFQAGWPGVNLLQAMNSPGIPER